MSWKQDPQDPLNHKYSGFTTKLVKSIDARIDDVMTRHKDRGLIDAIARIYWDSSWELKGYNGTSAQWPWLAEFCVFRCVKKHIEKEVGQELIPQKVSDWSYGFVDRDADPNYRLYHSFLPEKVDGKVIKPDVAFFVREKLLFTMDVKVAVASSASLNEALWKLTETARVYKSKPYLVVVAQNLTFSVDAVREQFQKFRQATGKVIGPLEGSSKEKFEELGSRHYSLEECFNENMNFEK